MSNAGVNTIDTSAFDAVMGIRGELLTDYDKLNADYDKIISTLLENWDGKGAEAFEGDATKVKTNIGGIYDILKTMSDTLLDCKEIITLSDNQIGDVNREPLPE